MYSWQISREMIGKNLTALHIVTCAKNRLRQTIHSNRHGLIAH